MWTVAGSDGRGVIGTSFSCLFFIYSPEYLFPFKCFTMSIGVLEANFIEPAHDKQGFERTTILSRLEAKLVQMQKSYWFVSFANLSLKMWCFSFHNFKEVS